MVSCIESHIPKDRYIVLVGHGCQSDLDCLERLGFYFRNKVPVWDTYLIAPGLALPRTFLQGLVE
jgi:ribonuclease D